MAGTSKLDRTDRVFEVSMTTLVKFDSDPSLQKGMNQLNQLIHNKFYIHFLFLDVLESAQAKGVDTVEQPIQAQQSQSLLNESEPTASHPKEQHAEPELIRASASSSYSSSWFLLSFALMAASCLYN